MSKGVERSCGPRIALYNSNIWGLRAWCQKYRSGALVSELLRIRIRLGSEVSAISVITDAAGEGSTWCWKYVLFPKLRKT